MKKKSHKLKAASLFYAVVLSMLMGVLMLSIISMSYFHKIETEIYNSTVDLIYQCKSAETILLAEHKRKEENKWIRLPEFEDLTFMKFKFWGVWKAGMIKSQRRKDEVSKEFIFGAVWNDDNTVIHLKNSISGLNIAGDTKISGNAAIQGSRIKPAFIEGQSFSGGQLIDGKISDAIKPFPQLNKSQINSWTELAKGKLDSDSLLPYGQSANEHNNNFLNKTLILHSHDSITIGSKSIQGNVAIVSKKAIFVHRMAELTNVILCAPRIFIGEGFVGEIQCFATQKIEIHENTVLSYPSALVVLSENEDSEIKLSKNSKIEGVVILNKANTSKGRNVIKLNSGSVVTGQVFSNSSVESRGTINGQIITDDFLLKTSSSTYKNHLLNTTLDVRKLPNWFCGLMFNSKSNRSKKMIDL